MGGNLRRFQPLFQYLCSTGKKTLNLQDINSKWLFQNEPSQVVNEKTDVNMETRNKIYQNMSETFSSVESNTGGQIENPLPHFIKGPSAIHQEQGQMEKLLHNQGHR